MTEARLIEPPSELASPIVVLLGKKDGKVFVGFQKLNKEDSYHPWIINTYNMTGGKFTF